MPLKVVPKRDRKLYRAVKRGENRRLRRGEILCRMGDPARDVFLVREGHLRHVRPGEGSLGGAGHRGTTVAVTGPWEMAGEEALLSGAQRRWTLMAGEATQVTVLDGPSVRTALQTSQKTLEAFLAAKEEEVALARELGESRRSGGARSRLGALLLHLASRHGKRENRGVHLPLFLTHQLLADLAQAHRSTVTTLLNDWIYAGVLEQEGQGIWILQPDGLGGTPTTGGARPQRFR